MLTDLPRILIVEDDPVCRGLLEAVFDLNGFSVSLTDTVLGAKALLDRLKPDVILLDLGLPFRSGASWLAELKTNPTTADLPVVILSGLSEVLPFERRLLASAVVRKPFRTSSLVETVRAACRPPRPVRSE